MAPEISIVALSRADRDAALELDQSAFGFDNRDLDPELGTAWIEWDRAFCAWRDDRRAGLYAVFSLGLGVPARPPRGATTIPMAGLSWVAVHPDHRRQGVMSAMIRHHLDDTHGNDRGEAVSGLFASESGIYGRFGYGMATQSQQLVLPGKAELRMPRLTGQVTTRFESADSAVHDKVVKRVYDAECLLRPGHTVRPPVMWERFLADTPARRPAGAESLKILIAERDGEPTGYVVLRRTASWGEHRPEGKIAVNDFQALDTESAFALWRRVLDFDLIAEVTTSMIAADDPMMVWAGEAGARTRAGHSFWIRLVDVAPALEARGYAANVDAVLELTDQMCPWNAGRWRLTASADGTSCDRTSDPADLRLDVRELASAYLGGVTLDQLGRAGLVDEVSPGTLDRCSAAFRSRVMPATPYMF